MSGYFEAIQIGDEISLRNLFQLSEPGALDGVEFFYVKDRSLAGGYLVKNGERQVDGYVFGPIPISEIDQWTFVSAETTSGFVDELGMDLVTSAETIKLEAVILTEASPAQIADAFRDPLGDGSLTAAPDGEGYKVDQFYKQLNYEISPYPSKHLGVDWNGDGGGSNDIGLAVNTIANGVVTKVDYGFGLGNFVVVSHRLEGGEYVHSLYGHLESVNVVVGQRVTAGTQIGELGDEGTVSAHLHMEITSGSQLPYVERGYNPDGPQSSWVDPITFIDSLWWKTLSVSEAQPADSFTDVLQKDGTVLQVGTAADRDRFKLSVEDGHTYRIVVSGTEVQGSEALSNPSFTIRKYDPTLPKPEYVVKAVSADQSGSVETLDWTATEDGDYFIYVGGDPAPLAGGYSISVIDLDYAFADGPMQSKNGTLRDESSDVIGVVSIEAPTFVGDGDADYTVSLAGVGRGLQYNIAYIIDVSGSMGGTRISDAKDAYIELTKQLVELRIADVANFAVIPFNSSSTLYADLTAQEAIERIASLSAGGGTSFGPALANAETFFSSANTGQTNIAYFLSDGQGSGASDSLTNIANVQAFGIGSGANLSSLNIIDSDDAVSLNASGQLVDVLTGSSVDVSEIDRIEIKLKDEVVRTITPGQLVNGPLGLQYTGTLSGLDVGASAQNLVSATVYLKNGAVCGEVELSIASALNDTSMVANDTGSAVIFGALSTFFDADASGAQNVNLLGNNLDNSVVATNVGGTFSTFGGDDVFYLGNYAKSTVDRVIDGGDGYDVIEYVGDYIQNLVNKIANIIKVGSNTDTITNVEEIRFSDAVLDTATLTVTYLNSSPIANDDAFSVGEDQMLVGDVLDDNGNGPDSDPDGDALRISLVDGPAEGELILNADGSFSYVADSDVFDLASPGDLINQSFTYQVEDGNGGVAQATATISVTILDDGEMVYGGNGQQTLTGTDGGEDLLLGENGDDELHGLDGADTLSGGRGDDVLFGGEGPDFLFGGLGNDRLRGGIGNDELTGGKGEDSFVFALGHGTDIVHDFGVGEDSIVFEGLFFDNVTVGQVGDNATISWNGELLVTLIGVDSSTVNALDFVFNT